MRWLAIFLFPLIANASVNVTNYGAIGDLTALANVSTTSGSTTIGSSSASFVSGDLGKLLEVWNAGILQTTSNQTLVGVITQVVSGTSVKINYQAGRTDSGLAGVYATDSRPGFSNCIAAASTPMDTVIIPAGNYLLINTNIDDFWPAGVFVRRGGITFQGTGSAILTGQGGWRNTTVTTAQGTAPQGCRGTLFQMLSPMTNNFPLIWTNLTFYGGTFGYEGGVCCGPSITTGEGWDVSHHAIAYWSQDGSVTLTSTNNLYGCIFHGWRGETIISGLNIPGGFMTASNCAFYDGNATVFNMNMAHDWNSCRITNYQQVEEFYRDYTTNQSIFRNGWVEAIQGNYGIVMNGGYYGNPTYTITNNVFYSTNGNTSHIGTTPASEVLITSNRFSGGVVGVNIGIAGYQDGFNMANSNIVVSYNLMTNVFIATQGGGYGVNYAINCYITGNIFQDCSMMISGNGVGTNIVFTGNYANYANHDAFDGLLFAGQYAFDNGNTYPIRDYSVYPISSELSYATGSKALVGFGTNTVDDSAAHLFVGAILNVTNSIGSNVWVYPRSTASGSIFTVTNNSFRTFYWNGTLWTPDSLGITILTTTITKLIIQ